MKFTLATFAVLVACTAASPVLEPRANTTSGHPVPAWAKRGASYNQAGAVAPLASNVSWAYDWAPAPVGALPSGVEFVPMLWGTDVNHLSGWAAHAEAAIANNATHILGFNEPDNAGQSNLTAQQAAAAWMQYIQPYGNRTKLVSPAVTNGGGKTGLAWLDAFFAACGKCQIDAVAIHIYDSATNVQYFKNYISGVSARYGNRPVWVTEFRGSGSVADEAKFINTMVPWLTNLSSVERFAYFGAFSGILLNGTSQLSTLGAAYINSTSS